MRRIDDGVPQNVAVAHIDGDHPAVVEAGNHLLAGQHGRRSAPQRQTRHLFIHCPAPLAIAHCQAFEMSVDGTHDHEIVRDQRTRKHLAVH